MTKPILVSLTPMVREIPFNMRTALILTLLPIGDGRADLLWINKYTGLSYI